MPRHRNRTASGEDTDGEHDHGGAMGSGINRECEVGGLPPRQQPAEQRGKAGGDLHLRLTGRRFVGPVIEPLAQTLAEGLDRSKTP
ncbi:MAG: hypothetical protein HY670_04210 [Chloroflexi bacterium]|nr:hypothetical protein [Chloroflexota bacterium]